MEDQKLYKIAGYTTKWPSSLKSLDEAAEALGLSPSRLLDLADSGFAPHFRIDGGTPFFRISELKQWAAGNLLEVHDGKPLPEPVRVIVPAERVRDWRRVPYELQEIESLRDITSECSRVGIYFLCKKNELQYVGQSVCVHGRVGEHAKGKDFDSVYFLPWRRNDLDRLEGALIRALRPPMNGRNMHGTMNAPNGKDATADAIALQEIGMDCDGAGEVLPA